MLLENPTYADYPMHNHISLNQRRKISKSELEGAIEKSDLVHSTQQADVLLTHLPQTFAISGPISTRQRNT